MKPLIVVMGVSGSGKSTVGGLLAAELDVPFVDADDLHPAANVAKMAAGHPLTDDDRWPWLARVASTLSAAEGTGMVVACSVLRRVYREAILASEPSTRFVFLSGSRALLAARMSHRPGHFMPASLLDSQLARSSRSRRTSPASPSTSTRRPSRSSSCAAPRRRFARRQSPQSPPACGFLA